MIIFPDYAMLLSLLFSDFTMLISLRTKLKIKKPKIQKQKRRKPGFTKRIGRKCRLI